jgi:hypothetical protein
MQVIFDSSETPFSSLTDAIVSPSIRKRHYAAKMSTAAIKDLTIEAAFWTKDSLRFHLTEGKMLCFVLSNGTVGWNVQTSYGEPFEMKDDDTTPLLLRFPNGTESLWDPAQVIRPRINKKIVRIAASMAWVFLYTEQCPALLLAKLCGEGGYFRLYWSDL